ncbi:flagellar hook-length control protein FliK [Methylophilus sp. 5]|uniref:flagellar hook-length control protein FliK n=1 Tax=Methylophilus sp. 5 TaxID=1112274 RepID=UPI00048F898B|nr:flagellar hook-length control protein FliK [Methylophilus sp. 5]
MLPIPQVLSPRLIASETESLRAVSSIMPVEGTQSEAPLWERMRPGMQFTGLILQKESGAAKASELAQFKVQIQLPNQPPATVQMQLPAYLAQQQTLHMQFMGLAQQGTGKDQLPQVKWGLQPGNGQTSANSMHLADAALLTDMSHADHDEHLQTMAKTAAGQASLVELSPPAKHLQRWLSSSEFQQQTTALQAQTVVSHSPQKPQVLAQDLKHALDSSGLFYEAHLKEATLGSRPWHQLLQEPQNKPAFMPPEMVAQQLQVLEQQRVVWHGEVWPGQTMQWQVNEQENSAHSADEPVLNSLQSDLTLQLPRLGEVSVKITMVNGRFSVRVAPGDASALKEMQSGRSQLAMSLQSVGLKLESLQISRDDTAQDRPHYAAG